MMRCNRCQWTGDNLTDHILDSGHPACILCDKSLTATEAQTCAKCVARVRADLADIEALWAELPEAAEALKPSWSASEGRSGGESHTIPGGDALVLLGPGSDGRAQTYAIANDLESSHAEDEWPSDAQSALFTLASWEDDFRRTFGHPAAGLATVTDSVAYLTANLDTGARAANMHPAFDEFAADVSRLRARMQQATGAAETPVRAPAACFECQGPLERHWTDEGLAEDWTCRHCKRSYDSAQYLLAVRAKLEKRAS